MKIWRFILLLLFSISVLVPFASAKEKNVYIVPIESTVEKGLVSFLDRALNTAEANDADLVIFEVNTPGGAVDAAGEIAKLLTDTPVKTVAFVNNRALSAGAYISLSADEIYMVPSATMGSAAVIDSAGNAADKKAQSYWLQLWLQQPSKMVVIRYMQKRWLTKTLIFLSTVLRRGNY